MIVNIPQLFDALAQMARAANNHYAFDPLDIFDGMVLACKVEKIEEYKEIRCLIPLATT